MKTLKCNCKRCAKLGYMRKSPNLYVNVVYCERFPKGEQQPICCNQYEKIKGKK